MIPGLEYRFRWQDMFSLNLRETYPRVKLNRITGLAALAELSGENEQATRRIGEIPREAFRRGKTATFEGSIEALSLDSLRDFAAQIAGGFAGTSEGQMIATQHPTYGAKSRTFWARCVLLEMPEQQPSPHARHKGYSRPFACGLRLSDPRIYDGVEVDQNTSLTATTGGFMFPITLPLTINLVTGQAGVVTVDNTGEAETDATIDLYGPSRLPIIENLTIGRKLRFDNLEIATGDFLRVDFRNRLALRNGVNDWTHKLNIGGSDWWDAGVPCLIPGENTLRYRGSVITVPPAYARIRFYPAFV